MLPGNSQQTHEAPTVPRRLRHQIEVGMCGTLITLGFYLVSAIAEGLSHGEIVWISYAGSAAGILTLVCVSLSGVVAR